MSKHENEKKKQLLRQARICLVSSRCFSRPWQHLAISVFGSKIRRRNLFADLYYIGIDLWIQYDCSRDLNRTNDRKKSCRCIPQLWKNAKWLSFGGWINAIIPILIVPYYSVIGGWVIKYLVGYITGHGSELAQDGYFSSFIANGASVEIVFLLFTLLTLGIIFAGVRNGVERVSRMMMPVLVVLSVIIAAYSVTRPGALEGVKYFWYRIRPILHG